MSLSFWRVLLPGMALMSLLLSPLLQPPIGDRAQAAFCGTGQAQTALAVKMRSVAPPDLLALLGYQEPASEHCVLCLLGAAFVALLVLLGWRHFERQRRCSFAVGSAPLLQRLRQAYPCRAPPRNPLF